MEGSWCIKDIAFVDDWTKKDYENLVKSLRKNILEGGMVYGAFTEGCLKGFLSVSGTLFGTHKEYLDLMEIYVSEELRGRGVGTKLFQKEIGRAHV